MSRFTTTNSTYGSFYLDIQNKVKEDQEKQKDNPTQVIITLKKIIKIIIIIIQKMIFKIYQELEHQLIF